MRRLADELFEARVIIWRSYRVPFNDTLEKMNDLYVKVNNNNNTTHNCTQHVKGKCYC